MESSVMFSLCLTPVEWQELVNFFSFRKSINRTTKISRGIYKKLVENPIKPKKDFSTNQVPLIQDYNDTLISLTDEERQELLRYFNFKGKYTLSPFSKAMKSICNKLVNSV